jgi:hypothetical protein
MGVILRGSCRTGKSISNILEDARDERLYKYFEELLEKAQADAETEATEEEAEEEKGFAKPGAGC